MGKNSKRRRRRSRRKQEKAYLPIPAPSIKRFRSDLIPENAARIESDVEPELVPLRISFENYNDKLCGIQNLKPRQSKEVVRAIRQIGACKSREDFGRKRVEMKPIINAGVYSVLFKRLDKDAEVKEHVVEGRSRIFYSILYPKKLCRIIAITSDRHLEIGKKFGTN